MTWERGEMVRVTVAEMGLSMTGTITGFPAKRVEYPTRPVIVRLGPGAYVTVDLSRLQKLAG